MLFESFRQVQFFVMKQKGWNDVLPSLEVEVRCFFEGRNIRLWHKFFCYLLVKWKISLKISYALVQPLSLFLKLLSQINFVFNCVLQLFLQPFCHCFPKIRILSFFYFSFLQILSFLLLQIMHSILIQLFVLHYLLFLQPPLFGLLNHLRSVLLFLY